MESATNNPLDKNNNGSSKCGKIMSKGSKNYEKYSLRPRSIQVRIETEKRRKEDRKKEPKPKQKPPPLSKYRRKTANARERTRMKEINLAFDNLQKLVPSYPQLPVNSTGRTCEKLTKITTLRLAMNYIDNLKSLLTSSSLEDDFSSGSASSASSTCGSNSLSAHSEFSPGSAYTLSPVSSPPDCLQTVMRGVVSPSFALSPASSTSGSSVASPGPCSSAASPSSSTSSTMVSNPGTFPATNIVIMPKYQQLHQPHFQSRMLLSQLNNNGMSACTGTNVSSTSSSFQSFNIHDYLPSPQMTPGAATNLSYTQPYASNVLSNSFADSGRIISSLNDSDLSEYASDLLSDTGDDPMFEDLIGVGVVASDFPDLLLEADDNLHFANDLTIPGH